MPLKFEGKTDLRNELEPLACTTQQDNFVGLKVKPKTDISV